MLKTTLAASSLLVLVGCGPALTTTTKDIHRLDGNKLTTCTVVLGWTQEELVAQCGQPDRTVIWDDGGECALYRTDALAFDSDGEVIIAACLDLRDARKRVGLTKRDDAQAPADDVMTVVAVFPLTRDEALPPPRSAPPGPDASPALVD